MHEYTLIFPNQLFERHPALAKDRRVVIWKHPKFFSPRFHPHKLGFHQASIQCYQTFLGERGFEVEVIERELSKYIQSQKVSRIHFADPTDLELENELLNLDIERQIYETPQFLTAREEGTHFFEGKAHFSMASFYISQRKRLNLLMDGKGKPLGGKWSLDSENREKLPPELIPKEAFDSFRYPINFSEARAWLHTFLSERLVHFGSYQDALVPTHLLLYHSLLTPMLNSGLLTPKEVLETTLLYAEKSPVPLNSLEGFLRQIIGWREFVRLIYLVRGKEQMKANFFGHTRSLPEGMWDGATGVQPIDQVIQKVLQFGYCHHIERLMVIGNFLLLCECNPREVYQWFMDMFIDSYEWVMVPNVFGMSQFADGGLMVTKPYISGSNYLKKMGIPKGEWCPLWDQLFWRFMGKHRAFFERNPRLKWLTSKLGQHQETSLAEKFLNKEPGRL